MQLTSNLREEMGLCWKQFWFSNMECIFDTSIGILSPVY